MEIQKALAFAVYYGSTWDETDEQIKDLADLIRSRDKAIIERCKEQILADHPAWDLVADSLDSILRDLS
jgi:formylmethanofuran dehydrogenase subunit A